MTLFIDQTGVPTAVFANLVVISGSDGGLGTSIVAGDPTVLQVTYAQSVSSVTANRLNTLVNSNFGGTPIVITGLPSSGQDPTAAPGTQISGNGVTFVDGNGVIRVVYDTGQCFGAGIATFDTSNNPIPTPNPVIVYHELSHALHAATGTTASTSAAEEVAAEKDENDERTALGCPLRDVNNHNGACGGVPTACGTVPGSGGVTVECFVVTAAYASAREPEIERLRQVRELFASGSRVGQEFFDLLYAEYGLFSPRLAADMHRSPELRVAVRLLLVNPVLDCCTIIQQYCAHGYRTESLIENVAMRLGQTRRVLRDHGITARDAHWFSRGLVHLGRQPPGSIRMPSGDSRGFAAIALLSHLAQVLDRSQTSLPLTRWGLSVPLARYWHILAAALDKQPALPALAGRLLDSLPEWLASAPTIESTSLMSLDMLVSDLRPLLAALPADPAFQQAVYGPLLQRYRRHVTFDLEETLSGLHNKCPASPDVGEVRHGQ